MSTSPYWHWCGTTLFQSGEGQKFPLLTHAFGPGSQCKHQDLYPPTTCSKNLSLSPSYCSRCSKQTPTRVAFFSSFQPFDNHNAETFRYPRTCMTMWCTHSTLMQKHYTMINLHHLILLGTCVQVQNVESMNGACQVLSAVPILFDSLVPVKHWRTLQRVIVINTLHAKMNACDLASSAYINWMMQHCAWLDKSVTVLHCAHITQSNLLMTYACHSSDHWPLSEGTRMINLTLHVTRQYMLFAYFTTNIFL